MIREGDEVAGLTHNLRTAVIDTEGRLSAIHRGADWTAAGLVSDIGRAR